METDNVAKQIDFGSRKAGKTYGFDEDHDKSRPAQWWFQESDEGLILFVVFYTQACRWSRCLGCNLPSQVSRTHVDYTAIIAQVDFLMTDPGIAKRRERIRKVIVSNNGSVLDEDTFSSTALMYLIAQLNLNMPNLSVLAMESRPEYVDTAELEFISRALAEGDTPTHLEIAIGFEAFDNHIRNNVFDKGLSLESFEELLSKMAPYGFHLKSYFMQKPVPNMSDEDAVTDIRDAIDYLSRVGKQEGVRINMHLNPTYAAVGTVLETAFKQGKFTPPRLVDVIRAAQHAKGKDLSVFVGLSDEGLAIPGGSFLDTGGKHLLAPLEQFNRNQDFNILDGLG
ncbi:MAG: hypothetical protein HKM93_21405 [Desulfobacteraceae bacterium]|nr:hypothetical protein [Desulfobacteraceae bacterium]